jgi:hypothetical protein
MKVLKTLLINGAREKSKKVKIEKEDAYFIYTTSIGLVNLLSRKVQEFKKSNND